jgi:hypothetical protein
MTTEKTQEFTSDEQRDAYISALEVEVRSTADRARAPGTDEQRATRARRAKETVAELDRVRGTLKNSK